MSDAAAQKDDGGNPNNREDIRMDNFTVSSSSGEGGKIILTVFIGERISRFAMDKNVALSLSEKLFTEVCGDR